MEKQYETGKWLKILMYSAGVSVVNSAVNYIPIIPGDVTTWISRGVVIAVILCMFRLAPANERYKTAGIFRLMMQVCFLVNQWLFPMGLLVGMASVLSLLAVYQEYKAHAELVEDQDERFARKWRRMFFWGIGASAVLTIGTAVLAAVVVMNNLSADQVSEWTVTFLSIPQFVFEVVYVLYLKKTAAMFEE